MVRPFLPDWGAWHYCIGLGPGPFIIELQHISGSSSLLDRACALQSALQDALRDPTFLPEGGKLGYLFQNTYQETVLSKAVAKLEQGR